MRVRMLQDQHGSLDGINLLKFDAGKIYDLPTEGRHDLAKVFLDAKTAEPAEAGWPLVVEPGNKPDVPRPTADSVADTDPVGSAAPKREYREPRKR